MLFLTHFFDSYSSDFVEFNYINIFEIQFAFIIEIILYLKFKFLRAYRLITQSGTRWF